MRNAIYIIEKENNFHKKIIKYTNTVSRGQTRVLHVTICYVKKISLSLEKNK